MKRTAKAHWEGTVKEGKGNLTTQSEVLHATNYSFKTRFTGEEKGTNPELSNGLEGSLLKSNF